MLTGYKGWRMRLYSLPSVSVLAGTMRQFSLRILGSLGSRDAAPGVRGRRRAS
jgi:hypothetical protein